MINQLILILDRTFSFSTNVEKANTNKINLINKIDLTNPPDSFSTIKKSE